MHPFDVFMLVCCVSFVSQPFVCFLLDMALHTKAGNVVTHRGLPMELGRLVPGCGKQLFSFMNAALWYP